MNQQPDKLFRDKLQSFQTPAPPRAWDRIEANLDKKNDRVLWLRIAASLLLVATATYLFWPADSSTIPQSELAGKKTERQLIPRQEEEKQIAPSAPAQENAIAEKPKLLPKRAARKLSPAVEKENVTVATEEEVAIENNTIASSDELAEEIVPTVSETQTQAVSSAETQKVKIIFTAEHIDNKYLDKKALAEATSDDKKPSTLKKLLDTAYDLKYNQDPFGELRQKKNEILALNFRTDKQRKEN